MSWFKVKEEFIPQEETSTPVEPTADVLQEPTEPEVVSDTPVEPEPTAEPTVIVDEPTVEAAADEPTEEKPLSFEEGWKQNFGDTSPQDFLKEYKTLKEQVQKDPYANDFTKKLNELYNNGESPEKIKSFIEAQSIDKEAMSDEDKLVWRMKMEDGVSEREARLLIRDQYKISIEDYGVDLDSLDDDERAKKEAEINRKIEVEKTKMKREARQADSFIDDHIIKVSTPTVKEDEKVVTERISKSVETYTAKFDKEYSGLIGEMEITGGENPLKFRPAMIEGWKPVIKDMVTAALQLNPDGDEAYIREVLKRRYIADNYESLLKSAVEHARNVERKRSKDEEQNIAGKNGGDIAPKRDAVPVVKNPFGQKRNYLD